MATSLCLDFGTSSIRAVVRHAKGDIEVLPIGQVTRRQEIDGASIPSGVSIDADKQTVRFGQHAYEAIARKKNLAFWETSPKLWLKEPKKLGMLVDPDIPVTRRDLLTGLMGYALFAANATEKWQVPKSPEDSDIRIAHPVWPSAIKEDADRALRQIAWLATQMATAGDWGVTSVEILQSWTTPEDQPVGIPQLAPKVDTIEPIAAAVELIPHLANQRRICVVVDVGAGTSDIGVFQQLVPDEKIRKPNKLVPAGPAISVFKAGDAIDQALIMHLEERFPAAFRANAETIRSGIRGHKQNIFSNKRIQFPGIDLTLQEFEITPAVLEIGLEIRKGLERCIYDARSSLSLWFSASHGIDRTIFLIMAGGGAALPFLQKKLLEPLQIEETIFNFEVMPLKAPSSLNMHGAGYTRLAVGLGGVNEGYEGLIFEHSKLLRIPSLGSPKQVIG